MKYIDVDKLYEYLEQVGGLYPRFADDIVDNAVTNVINDIKNFISSLQQEPRFPECNSIVEKVFGTGNLEGFEYREAEMLVTLAKEELLKSLQQGQPLTVEKVVEQCKKFGGNPEVIQPEVELDKITNEEFASRGRTTEYGLEVTYNRAELYQLIKRLALAFNARKED